jgi:hypothetical protein
MITMLISAIYDHYVHIGNLWSCLQVCTFMSTIYDHYVHIGNLWSCLQVCTFMSTTYDHYVHIGNLWSCLQDPNESVGLSLKATGCQRQSVLTQVCPLWVTRRCHNLTHTCHNLQFTCNNLNHICRNLIRSCHNLTDPPVTILTQNSKQKNKLPEPRTCHFNPKYDPNQGTLSLRWLTRPLLTSLIETVSLLGCCRIR